MATEDKKQEQKQGQEQPKQEQKPSASPDKKQTNKKQQPKKAKPLVHIDDFLAEAVRIYGISAMQVSGFKAYMSGKHYMTSIDGFTPYLKDYLGK